jgi:hypothetical protein
MHHFMVDALVNHFLYANPLSLYQNPAFRAMVWQKVRLGTHAVSLEPCLAYMWERHHHQSTLLRYLEV